MDFWPSVEFCEFSHPTPNVLLHPVSMLSSKFDPLIWALDQCMKSQVSYLKNLFGPKAYFGMGDHSRHEHIKAKRQILYATFFHVSATLWRQAAIWQSGFCLVTNWIQWLISRYPQKCSSGLQFWKVFQHYKNEKKWAKRAKNVIFSHY